MSSIACPDCMNFTLDFPIHQELMRLVQLHEAEHDLLQAVAKGVIKITEDLKRLEARIFPPEGKPRRKGSLN